MLSDLTPHLQNASWSRDTLEAELNAFADAQGVKFGKLAAPLRAALAGPSYTDGGWSEGGHFATGNYTIGGGLLVF